MTKAPREIVVTDQIKSEQPTSAASLEEKKPRTFVLLNEATGKRRSVSGEEPMTVAQAYDYLSNLREPGEILLQLLEE